MGERIFISHASKDEKLSDKSVDLLQTGINISSDDIFCTSLEGLGIDVGVDFIDFIKEQIQSPEHLLSF